MRHIKHFSFDLWFTLIKSNPTFKKERALYFHKHFNSHNKALQEVETVFRTVDLMCNNINEKTGKNIDAEEMYLMVIYMINDGTSAFANIDTADLYSEMEQLIINFPPSIFNEQTKVCLQKLKEKSGVTLSILSNTAFVKGSTLRLILKEIEFAQYFDFQIYSDETQVSKPNKEIYRILLEKIVEFRDFNIALNEIIHVGDNPVADILGAKAIGINAFQVNTNNKLISNLFD